MPTRRDLLLSAVVAGLGVSAGRDLAQTVPHNTQPWMDDRMVAHLQSVLGLSDDEWTVVAPKVEPVLMLIYQRERFVRTRLPKIPHDNQPRDVTSGGNIIATKIDPSRYADHGSPNADLAEQYFRLISLASQATPFTGELRDALTQYRTARHRSDEELAHARSELRELMDLKQEAALVVMGILD